MSPTNDHDPIARSRRNLMAWGRMGEISARPHEVMRILRSEVHALETLALEHPRNAPAAAQLIAAYQGLAARLQKREAGARARGEERRVA